LINKDRENANIDKGWHYLSDFVIASQVLSVSNRDKCKEEDANADMSFQSTRPVEERDEQGQVHRIANATSHYRQELNHFFSWFMWFRNA